MTTDPAKRAFAFEVTFFPHLWPKVLGTQKPPLHFHPFQEEYIQVLQGKLCVDDDLHGEQVLTPADGEFCIKPWANHRLYPPVGLEAGIESETPIRFLLAAEDTAEMFKLDLVFFENWYAYQDETVAQGKPVNLIQVMSVCWRPSACMG